MMYLIPMFNCYIFDKETYYLQRGGKYFLTEIDYNPCVIFGCGKEIPFILNIKNLSVNISKISLRGDVFYFLFPIRHSDFFRTSFKYKSKTIEVCLSSMLTICLDGEILCEEQAQDIRYSHYEILKSVCLIYFEGKRNYVVVIKDEDVCFSNYYDECNIDKDERWFMSRTNDFLNHGLVCKISNETCESYLVYLDEYELNLKQEFVPFVFLDCLKVGNYKYCNELLTKQIRTNKEEDIKKFFPKFDFFYPITSNDFVLIKKNTLAGIYSFKVENNLIVDITSL